MMQTRWSIQTPGPGLTEITGQVAEWVASCGANPQEEAATEGLLTLFIRHTSASLLIQENADPDVLMDLQAFFERIAPWGEGLYAHDTEGPDDMPAHIRAALTQTSLSVPVCDGRLLLGRWQGIYMFEHRAVGSRREIVGHLAP